MKWILIGFFIFSFFYWLFGPSDEEFARRWAKKEKDLRAKYGLEDD